MLIGGWKNDSLMGLAAVYCNDLLTNVAYLTLLGVRREFRACGLGSKLFAEAINQATTSGMKAMQLETWEGSPAIDLYKKQGFRLIDRTFERTDGVATLHLSRDLHTHGP